MTSRLNLPAPAADGLVAIAVAFAGMAGADHARAYDVFAQVAGAAVIVIWAEQVAKTTRTSQWVMAFATIGLGIAWTLQFGSTGALFGMAGWLIFLIRRLRSLGMAMDDDLQTKRLVWDLGFLTVAWVWSGLATDHRPVAAAVMLPLATVGVVTVGVRLFAMHRAQLETAQVAVGSTRSVWPPFAALLGAILASLTIIAAVPSLRILFLLGLLTAFAVFVVAVFWRDLVVQTVFLLGLSTLIYLVVKLLPHHSKMPPSKGALPGRPPIHATPEFGTALSHVDWGLLLLATAITVVVFLIYRSSRIRLDARSVPVGFHVERERLRTPRSRRRIPPHLPPLRLVVFRWLRWEAGRGLGLMPGETVRQYAARRLRGLRESVAEPAFHGTEETLGSLVARYEAERYGREHTPADVAKWYEQALRGQGLGP